MERSISQVHDGRGITGNTNYKEEVIRKARKMDAIEADAEKQSLAGEAYDAGSREGFRKGFNDFEQRLAASSLYSPITDGSQEDTVMQENTARGLNYKEPQEVSLLDAIGEKLGSASNWFSKQESSEEEPTEMQKNQEFEQMQYESELAGLAELKQTLDSQQR